jgi:hypothetical protein
MLLVLILLLGNEANLEAKLLQHIHIKLPFPFYPCIEHLHGFGIVLVAVLHVLPIAVRHVLHSKHPIAVLHVLRSKHVEPRIIPVLRTGCAMMLSKERKLFDMFCVASMSNHG